MTSSRALMLSVLTLSVRSVHASCDPEFDSNCSRMSYTTRAALGFVIFLVIFGTISALAVGRRRRALRRQQQLAAAGVSVHPTAAGGVWSQHLAGGPAQPPQAHYNSLYAPGYMAPPPGPPPASEQMYPAPPKYEPNYDPPAGPPPGFSDKSNAV